jgi:hypothetical protein
LEQLCKHDSFSYEIVTATGANMKLGIVRCSRCGTAIGAFIPQIPDALNALGDRIAILQKDIQRLKS